VGKATMVRSTVVKTHGKQRELTPTPVEPPTVRHLPLEHACSCSYYDYSDGQSSPSSRVSGSGSAIDSGSGGRSTKSRNFLFGHSEAEDNEVDLTI
jgi:hypothetical protein